MAKILITGCNGQLGRAMNEVLSFRDENGNPDGDVKKIGDTIEIINADLNDLDITDYEATMRKNQRIVAGLYRELCGIYQC